MTIEEMRNEGMTAFGFVLVSTVLRGNQWYSGYTVHPMPDDSCMILCTLHGCEGVHRAMVVKGRIVTEKGLVFLPYRLRSWMLDLTPKSALHFFKTIETELLP